MALISTALSLPKPPSSLALSSSQSNFFTGSTALSQLFSGTRPVNHPRLSDRCGTRVRTRTVPARKGFTCNAMFGLGVPELVVIAGVAALLFGPKKLPEVGKSIGKTVKSFQQAAKEFESELKREPDPAIESAGEKATAVGEEDKHDEKVSSSKESV